VGTLDLLQQGIRQGAIIDAKSLNEDQREAIQYGRSCAKKRNKPVVGGLRLIVLSQDCDINNRRDKHIELLVIKQLKNKDVRGNLTRPTNYRKIQLRYDSSMWEAEAELISIIDKDVLKDVSPMANSLDPKTLNLVIDWRIGRYRRRPLPDRFNQDFIHGYINQPDNVLADFLEKYRDDIADIFVNVDPADDENATEYQVILNGIINDDADDKLYDEFTDILQDELTKLHGDSNNSLRFPQISESEYSSQEGLPLDLVYRQEEFSMSDISKTTLLNTNYLCYDEDSGD